MAKKSSKKSTPSNTNAAPQGMSLAPSHQSQPERFKGTQPGVTVEVSAPSPEDMAQMAADLSPKPEAKRTRTRKGLDREAVMAACIQSGLAHLPKSTTDMFGDAKGARIVVPKASSVTKLYVYRVEDASLPGYHDAEARKAKGIGSVTHIVEHPTMEVLAKLLASIQGAQGTAGDTLDGTVAETKADDVKPSEGLS